MIRTAYTQTPYERAYISLGNHQQRLLVDVATLADGWSQTADITPAEFATLRGTLARLHLVSDLKASLLLRPSPIAPGGMACSAESVIAGQRAALWVEGGAV